MSTIAFKVNKNILSTPVIVITNFNRFVTFIR